MAASSHRAHGSVHDDDVCWVCDSRNYEVTILGEDLFDASDFVPPGTHRTSHWFDLCECHRCGHAWTATNHPSWLTTRAHDFIRYKEPTEHFAAIREFLQAGGVDLETCSLHTISYKDEPLLEFLRPGSRPGPDVAGLTRDWLPSAEGTAPSRLELLRDQLTSSSAPQRVILARRLLEHVASRSLLMDIFGLVDERTYLVLDMADFPRLAASTVDFVWNERRHYWSSHDLERLIGGMGLRCSVIPTPGPAEATLVAFVGGASAHEQPTAAESSPWHLVRGVRAARARIAEAIPAGMAVGVVGASHKGVSFVQILTPDDAVRYIFDDRVELGGLDSPAGHLVRIAPLADIERVPLDVAIVCVGARAIPSIAARLRAFGHRGRVVDSMFVDVRISHHAT